MSTQQKEPPGTSGANGICDTPDRTRKQFLAAQPIKGIPLGDEFVGESGILRIIPVSRRTLFSLREKGLPHVRLGKRVIFHVPSVREWLLRQQRGAE
jgi:hypothetical protein